MPYPYANIISHLCPIDEFVNSLGRFADRPYALLFQKNEMTQIPTIILKPNRDKTARQKHPWIFSGAIARVEGNPDAGAIVRVLDSKRQFVAFGYYNSSSQIAVRLLEWTENIPVDENWWETKLADSIKRRGSLDVDPQTDSYRLVFGESDLLPGLIVDKCADFLVIQCLTAGIENIKPIIVEALEELVKPSGIYERSDVEVRALEGLPQSAGLLAGKEPPEHVAIKENGFNFFVDLRNGHKTGFYLDQRDNRLVVGDIVEGKDVLDCFCYTGAFSIYALAMNARSVTLVDSSGPALATAELNLKLNGLESYKSSFIEADVFEYLRLLANAGKKYDVIILDPPKFASSKNQLKNALAGYKDINLMAMRLLKPEGFLATFSCSGAVFLETLKTVVFWAAKDAGRFIQVVKILSQGPDHPVLASFPESEYLKGLICRAL